MGTRASLFPVSGIKSHMLGYLEGFSIRLKVRGRGINVSSALASPTAGKSAHNMLS